ncbi:MAG: hypothetical protein J1E63_04165 [Muribaculaceae bacterium]|nr:hypothetical protein [Muribaculaceae bacterium]
MKKFYALALAAAVCVSANAAQRIKSTVGQVERFSTEKVTDLAAGKLNSGKLVKKAPAKAEGEALTIADYEGTYEWDGQSLLSSSGALGNEITITVTDEKSGEVAIDLMPGMFDPVLAIIDIQSGILDIPNFQYMGEDSDGAIYFYLKSVNADYEIEDGMSNEPDVIGTLDGLTITFEELDIFAIGDPYQEELGWYALTYANKFAPSVPDENWSDYCTGVLLDGWMVPALQFNDGSQAMPEDLPLEINIQRHNVNTDIYRIVNPYLELAEIFGSTGKGYIQMDLGNPDFVAVLDKIPCGISNSGQDLCCINWLGLYLNYYSQYDKETIIAALGDEINEDGTSTLDGDVVYCEGVGFNMAGAWDKFYTWNGAADNMNSTIIFDKTPGDESGVTSVAVDNNNAPTVYYNLQGVQVENPSKGIFIRSNGKTASKVYVR